MTIDQAIAQAEVGCTKAVEVALNAVILLGHRVHPLEILGRPVLMNGAIEVLLYQVGNGRLQTPFMLSVLGWYRRNGRISANQAAAVLNICVEHGLKSVPVAPVARPRHEGEYGVYECTVRTCRSYGREFDVMLPSEVRAATGRPVACNDCGDWVVLLRVEGERVPA